MTTNTTAIESMKSWEEENRSLREGLSDYCGYPGPSWRWFAPVGLGPSSPSWFSGVIAHPDEYHPRDPAVQSHFRRIEAQIAAGHRIVYPAPAATGGKPAAAGAAPAEGGAAVAALGSDAAAAAPDSKTRAGTKAAASSSSSLSPPPPPSTSTSTPPPTSSPSSSSQARRGGLPSSSLQSVEQQRHRGPTGMLGVDDEQAASAAVVAPPLATPPASDTASPLAPDALARREAAAEAAAEAANLAESTAPPPGCMARSLAGHGHHAPCSVAACAHCGGGSSSASSSASSSSGGGGGGGGGTHGDTSSSDAAAITTAATGHIAPAGDGGSAASHRTPLADGDDAPPGSPLPVEEEVAPSPDAAGDGQSVLLTGPADEGGARTGPVRRRAGRRREA